MTSQLLADSDVLVDDLHDRFTRAAKVGRFNLVDHSIPVWAAAGGGQCGWLPPAFVSFETFDDHGQTLGVETMLCLLWSSETMALFGAALEAQAGRGEYTAWVAAVEAAVAVNARLAYDNPTATADERDLNAGAVLAGLPSPSKGRTMLDVLNDVDLRILTSGDVS